MKIICRYNDPDSLPKDIPNNFDYGLEVSKEYLVMGMLTLKQSNNLYFLIDENGRPGWYPQQIFVICDNSLPACWFIKINMENIHVDYLNLIGFFELCTHEDFFNKLLEREEEVMHIYFKHKAALSMLLESGDNNDLRI